MCFEQLLNFIFYIERKSDMCLIKFVWFKNI